MTNGPLVSVIMPLYNKRPYVKRAIESIRQQTFTDWELIIVDDGSTDGSSDEIPQNDSKIRLFHQKNKGPGAARNRGIKMGSGDFVTFIDADNYYYPKKLEIEMDLLWKKKNADWMISVCEYDKDNQIQSKYVKDTNGNEIKAQPLVLVNAINEIQLQGLPIEGLCIKKILLDRLRGFNENMLCFENIELVVRCALMSPKAVIYPQPLYHIIDVPDSAFKISSNRIEGMRQKGESYYNLFKDYPEYSNYLSSISLSSLYSYIASLILTGKSAEARKYLNNKFPYTRDKRWLKMWVGSWLPKWLLQRLVSTGESLE
ncbi:MAG: glycosyltransferase family 2 protein [Candidatus Scalinduaceae bacterium]